MDAQGLPPVLVEGVEDRALGSLRQVGHELGEDDRAGTDQEGEVVGAPVIEAVLSAYSEPH